MTVGNMLYIGIVPFYRHTLIIISKTTKRVIRECLKFLIIDFLIKVIELHNRTITDSSVVGYSLVTAATLVRSSSWRM